MTSQSQGWASIGTHTLFSFSQRYNLATFPLHAGELLTAFVTYVSIQHVFAPVLSKTLAPKHYNNLPNDRTRVNWNFRIVSFVQATMICVMALQVIIQRKGATGLTRDDRLWAYDPTIGRIQAYAAGYFLFDTVTTIQYFDILGWTSLAHGTAALLIAMVGYRPFANYYGVNFLLYELSTPFLNIHWMFDKLRMTGTKAQLYNGILLMSTFFGCRIVWGTYQTWLLSQDIFSAWRSHLAVIDNRSAFAFPGALLATYFVANTILSGLNLYWFGLMIKAMRSRFTKDKKDSR